VRPSLKELSPKQPAKGSRWKNGSNSGRGRESDLGRKAAGDALQLLNLSQACRDSSRCRPLINKQTTVTPSSPPTIIPPIKARTIVSPVHNSDIPSSGFPGLRLRPSILQNLKIIPEFVTQTANGLGMDLGDPGFSVPHDLADLFHGQFFVIIEGN
jgi:hypothetical protein